MNPALIALHHCSKLRRELLIFRRFRNSYFLTRMRFVRYYGQEYIDYLANCYGRLNEYTITAEIIRLTKDIDALVAHIDIGEINAILNIKK